MKRDNLIPVMSIAFAMCGAHEGTPVVIHETPRERTVPLPMRDATPRLSLEEVFSVLSVEMAGV